MSHTERCSTVKCAENIRGVVIDVDGTLTDGGMLYRDDGTEGKKYNVRDGAGVALLRCAGIHLALVSGESHPTIERRAKKMDIDACFVGVKNKVGVVSRWLESLGATWAETACVVDEINDLPVVRKAALSFGVADGSPLVLREVSFVLTTKGGDGVLREVALRLLSQQGNLEQALSRYLISLQQAGDG